MKKIILLMFTSILLTVLCGFALLACNNNNTSERKFQYSVKNKIIATSEFSRSIWYSPIYDLNVSFKVISVDKNRIIVDIPYSTLLIGGNCVIDLIDTRTAMTRMVWKPYNQ